jgi:hypothetical protein
MELLYDVDCSLCRRKADRDERGCHVYVNCGCLAKAVDVSKHRRLAEASSLFDPLFPISLSKMIVGRPQGVNRNETPGSPDKTRNLQLNLGLLIQGARHISSGPGIFPSNLLRFFSERSANNAPRPTTISSTRQQRTYSGVIR